MKNVIIAIFSEESKTYEAMSLLKNKSGSASVTSSAIIKNKNGHITIQELYGDGDYDAHWATGGLIGGLVGVLGGPIGMLLGGTVGSLVGSGMDVDDLDQTKSVVNQVVTKLDRYKLALVIVADEPSTTELDEFLTYHGANEIIRKGFLDVQAEILQSEELEKELLKETKKKLREEKKEMWKEKAKKKQQEFQKNKK